MGCREVAYELSHALNTCRGTVRCAPHGVQVDGKDCGYFSPPDVSCSELVRRDVCGELALLQPKRQIGVTLRVVSKASCLFLARADFSPQLLPDETLREMRLLSKLYSGDDMLRARHFQDQEWEKAKKVYVREVIREVRDRKDAERRKVGGWS